MFCGHCGTQIPDGALFCPSCGKKIESWEQPNPTPPRLSDSGAADKRSCNGRGFFGIVVFYRKDGFGGYVHCRRFDGGQCRGRVLL